MKNNKIDLEYNGKGRILEEIEQNVYKVHVDGKERIVKYITQLKGLAGGCRI